MEILSLLTSFGAAEEVQGIGSLGIDFLAILAQAATFLLLFVIIKKFALEKIVKTLEARRKTIDDGVRLGREMESEKELLEEKIAEALQKARKEADKIIESGRTESAAVIKAAEHTATTKADAIIADAKVNIEENIAKARIGLEQEMRVLVAEATEAIIEEKLDAKKDESLIKRAFAKVGGKA